MKLFFAILFISQSALAWGPIGHRVVGEIAQKRLNPSVAKKVAEILENRTLADVSTWADLMRSDPVWKKAGPWHYVNIEDGKKYKDRAPFKGGDVIWAIEHFSAVLNNEKSSTKDKKEALSFIVHFYGDIHQPLHVSRRSDYGGNKIALKWFGKKTNLHEVWDEKIIELEQLSYTEYVDYIDKSNHENEKNWAKEPLMTWVQESFDMRPLVYDLPKKFEANWEYQYRFKTHHALNERLLKAGIRLAFWLNENLK